MSRILSAIGRRIGRRAVIPEMLTSNVRGLSLLSEDILRSDVEKWKNDRVVFAWQGEDHRPITKALEIKEGSTIFSIASAGYNPSMLLLENPTKVVMVDNNPTQIAWCMLYFSAIKNLTYEEFRSLVGFGEGATTTPDERGRIYDSLRGSLPSKALVYWDFHRDNMSKSGMYLFGNYIRLWGLGRFVPIAHSQETLDKFLSFADIDKQRSFYEEQWDSWRWRRAFQEALASEHFPAVFRPFMDLLAQKWLNRFLEICINIPNVDNPQIEIHLTNKISGKYGLPDFWRRENFAPIRERLDRFELIHIDVNEYFERTSENFDGFVLSNVGDVYSKGEHDQYVTRAIKRGKPGSRITYLSIAGTNKGWPDAEKDNIRVEQELSESLIQGKERGIFWDDLHIATLK
ncbi:unnamed protein product [Owenia fusiformis]|uniref:Uncharacterized protein n=1 Tax=Owenia fusiformis TaxID=6347 RepID=A0A8J1Y8P9_OWEFU|nr:unnamed protein product [Owenia fusiformis]